MIQMVNTFKTLIAISAAALISACTDISEKYENHGHAISISGTADGYGNIATRSQVGGSTEDGALFMEWSVGDMIGVFSDLSSNIPFKSNNSIPEANTTFSGSLNSGDIPRYAYYPYSEGISDKSSIPVNVPTEQLYTGENSVAAYDVKAADVVLNVSDGKYKIRMRQMLSLIRFEINLTDVQGIGVNEKLTRIELETGAPVSGEYTYNITDLDAGLTPKDGKQSTSLNISFPDEPSLDRQVIAYAVAVPGNQYGKVWNCKFITDRHQVVFTTEALVNFKAGSYYTIPLNASIIENNNADIEELPEPEETANCYVVSTTGEHSFLANVIGNGQKGIIPGAGFHTETAFISPKSARLIWQDVDGFIDPASVELRSDNRCYYRADKNTGNAVIAVYSGADATGEILWSWHIWGIGDEPLSDDTYISSAGYEYTVMDRPLGAHSKLSNTCVLYQWGRKDPFSNQNTVYFDKGTPSDVAVWPSVSGTDYGTLEYSIANPDKFITFSKTVSNGDWLQTQNNSLWGNDMEIPWNWPDVYGHPDCRPGWASQKTIYDPSPAGYRVASPYVWTGILKNKGDASTPGSSSTRLDQVNFIRYENDGWYFLLNPSDPEGVYYGTTGQRLGADGKQDYNGLYVYYFSSSPHRTRTMSTGLWCGKYVGATNSSSSAHENAIKAMELLNRGLGCAIRCEKE